MNMQTQWGKKVYQNKTDKFTFHFTLEVAGVPLCECRFSCSFLLIDKINYIILTSWILMTRVSGVFYVAVDTKRNKMLFNDCILYSRMLHTLSSPLSLQHKSVVVCGCARKNQHFLCTVTNDMIKASNFMDWVVKCSSLVPFVSYGYLPLSSFCSLWEFIDISLAKAFR